MLSLHVWPGKWDLPSIDVQCVAAILYLQLIAPGRFQIVECSNPDLSPSGQLPFMTHGEVSVSPLSSIVAYIASLDTSAFPGPIDEKVEILPARASLDSDMTPTRYASILAWRTYVDSHIGDLLANSFYALTPNYTSLIAPTLASFYPLPQAYWIPAKVRDAFQPRLEAAGLWEIVEEKGPEPPFNSWTLKMKREELDDGPEKVKKAFGKEKILEKARAAFDLMAGLIPQHSFIYTTSEEGPTSLDVHLAAHLLLILHAPLPNPILKTLLLESYPTLIDHALLVRAFAFPGGTTPDSPSLDSPSSSWTVLPERAEGNSRRPYPPIIPLYPMNPWTTVGLINQGTRRALWPFGPKPSIVPKTNQATQKETEEDRPEEEKALEKKMKVGRWIWYLAAGVGVVVYAFGSGMLRFEVVDEEEDDGEEADETDEDTGGL